jgi:hypothetical protein
LIYPILFVMFAAARLFAAEAVWVEGEDATEHNFRRHGWYDGVDKSLLSNREWLSHYSQQGEGRATYRFRVKEGGQYTWWLRTNVLLVTQHYRIDGAPPVAPRPGPSTTPTAASWSTPGARPC